MTQPTAEQLELARECAVTAAHSARFDDEILSFWVTAWSDRAKGIFEEGATQSALLAIQATEARMADAVEAERERCARIVERRAEARFNEHGTREWDTNATYYQGDMAEIYEALDEEADEIAAAIRSQSNG